ncbi:flagellar basal body L-ring protein FlgH [Sphingobium sp. Ant17]|uniref:flagellar basal body L-ring protein FlgH n=1 Tax=Sphingobium sp. Ant17 TaxID=1461752 RepID=UPI0004481B58|nr:flagellar basal body L-ring protein FlgH [Sphingobium sp. Ant17]EXS70796.1 flagellar L-ring protein FlgH [Sphingobium sp. Ant17]MDE0946029.1 flagellar basal body L-ring protein FlgH [Sphingobium sp.]OHD05855.1 MAG: flagellar biosynthesis protein FlgH [Sphingomonadales bacterium GWF1_63_6]
MRFPLLTLVGLVGLTVAVSPAIAGKKRDVERAHYAPTVVAQPPVPQANGSIFQVAVGYTPLTSGARATTVGDIITIVLVERTQATKSNSADTSRNGNIGLTPPTSGVLSKLFSASDVAMGGQNNFAGQGGATQSNALSGEITVTIAAVYPNGTMLVKGEKALTLNRGDEYIQISGLVRQADISPDNRIASTRVADAKIIYTGKGEIARASKQGWLQSFFSMISPF